MLLVGGGGTPGCWGARMAMEVLPGGGGWGGAGWGAYCGVACGITCLCPGWG